MLDENFYRRLIKRLQFVRRYIIVPCFIVSICCLLFAISTSDHEAILLNSIFVVFHVVNLVYNTKTSAFYEGRLKNLADNGRLQKIKDLYPSRL